MPEHSRTPIVAAVVSLSLLATIAVVAVILVGADASTTPVLVSLFGFLAPTLVALLALLRIEHVQDTANELHHVVNGRLDKVEGKVDTVLTNGPTTPPVA